MLTGNIFFKNFNQKINNKKIHSLFKKIFINKNQILNSLSKSYKNFYNKRNILKYKKFDYFVLIGMGGSILGSRAIYNFLKHKVKKTFIFIDNFEKKFFLDKKNKKRLNLIISKSGNTLETISNANIQLDTNHKNIFITENKKSYLMNLAKKLKADVIYHNNFIGGRYSVLSEVGMLPAELMGLDEKKFRDLNNLIKKKIFVNSLVENVAATLNLVKKGKYNSIILNYDDCSTDLFYWYQQLIAESLGKQGKGILPVVSNMPKDNHSLMQLYLDGTKTNFFTFFFVKGDKSEIINKKKLLSSHDYLNDKSLNEIKYSQFKATQMIFDKKKIPFRSFIIKKRNEKSLGELFTFFILESILLGEALKLNPYDQPAVELIKKHTKKILINS